MLNAMDNNSTSQENLWPPNFWSKYASRLVTYANNVDENIF